MNELLELEPRETDADELDVDTAFSRIAGPSPERGRCPHRCGDDVSHGDFEASTSW